MREPCFRLVRDRSVELPVSKTTSSWMRAERRMLPARWLSVVNGVPQKSREIRRRHGGRWGPSGAAAALGISSAFFASPIFYPSAPTNHGFGWRRSPPGGPARAAGARSMASVIGPYKSPRAFRLMLPTNSCASRQCLTNAAIAVHRTARRALVSAPCSERTASS